MAEPSTVWGLEALRNQVPDSVPGAYQLILRVPATRLSVGALGTWEVDEGTYVYSGSALGGVRQRVLRHLRPAGAIRWHIDYLRAVGRIIAIRFVLSPHRLECSLHEAAMRVPGAREPIPGFGASDCRCQSHLALLPGCESGEGAVAVLVQHTPAHLAGGVDWQHVVKRHGESTGQGPPIGGHDVNLEDHVGPDGSAGG